MYNKRLNIDYSKASKDITIRGDYNGYDIKTGDIFLFSGWTIPSITVKIYSGSVWNHVGIAIWIKNRLYCLESSPSLLYDAILNEEAKGIRLVPIEYLLNTNYAVAVRHLHKRYFNRLVDSLGGEHKYTSAVGRFIVLMHGRSFPDSFLHELVYPQLGFSSRYNYERMFCSELCMYWMSWISEEAFGKKIEYPLYKILPGTFSERSRRGKLLFKTEDGKDIFKGTTMLQNNKSPLFIMILILLLLLLMIVLIVMIRRRKR